MRRFTHYTLTGALSAVAVAITLGYKLTHPVSAEEKELRLLRADREEFQRAVERYGLPEDEMQVFLIDQRIADLTLRRPTVVMIWPQDGSPPRKHRNHRPLRSVRAN